MNGRANLMKKLLSCYLVAAMLASSMWALAGCGHKPPYVNPGNNYDVSLDVDYQTSATLKVGLYIQTDQDEEHWKEIADGFKLIFPKVNISMQLFSGNYYQELTKAFQAGTMPDILMVNSSISFVGIAKGLLLDLAPYISAEKEVNPGYEDQFIQSMWKLGQENYDGDQYFVPRSADRVVTHFNKAQLIAAGVDMSTVTNGWTWDDFMAACAKVKTWYTANKGAGRQFIAGNWDWEAMVFPMLESLGAKVFNADGTVALNSQATIDYLNMLNGLVNMGYSSQSTPTRDNFLAGDAAFWFHSQSVDVGKQALGDDYDVVTFPLVGDPATAKIGAGIAGYGIFSGIDQAKRNLAWQLLDFMLSKEGQNIMARAGITEPPIRVDMQDGMNLWRQGNESLNMDAYTWETDRNFATNFYLGQDPEKQIDLTTEVENMVDNVMMRPSPDDPQTAINTCVTNLNNIIKKAS